MVFRLLIVLCPWPGEFQFRPRHDSPHLSSTKEATMAAPAAVHPSEQTLQSYGLGRLDNLLSEAVAKHLAECDSCRVRVAKVTSDTFLGRLQHAQARPASFPPI